MDLSSYFPLFFKGVTELKQYGFIVGLFMTSIVFELPLYIMLILVIFRKFTSSKFGVVDGGPGYYPMISCIITCYSEGKDVEVSIVSLIEQVYPGRIEILVMVDGSKQNQHTYDAAMASAKKYKGIHNREVRVIPKYIRGGKVSSMNLGLALARGEIIMTLDGETSCDNNAFKIAAELLHNRNVIAIGGSVRVRNNRKNLVTQLQGVEYFMGINLGRQALSEMNCLNIISGAFGFFRKSMLKKVGGWRSGSGEDLDLTIRIQSMFSRYKNLRLLHSSKLISHTDAPETWRALFKQRLRWDGDMALIWIKRYRNRLSPSYMTFATSIILLWGGVFFSFIMTVAMIVFIPYSILTYQNNFIYTMLISMYVYYMIILFIHFIINIVLISDRKLYDCLNIPYLFLMPFYQFAMRMCTIFAIMSELVLKSHRFSTMAPWWVLRKSSR